MPEAASPHDAADAAGGPAGAASRPHAANAAHLRQLHAAEAMMASRCDWPCAGCLPAIGATLHHFIRSLPALCVVLHEQSVRCCMGPTIVAAAGKPNTTLSLHELCREDILWDVLTANGTNL